MNEANHHVTPFDRLGRFVVRHAWWVVAAWVALAPSIRDLGAFPADREAAFERWGKDTGDDEGWGRYYGLKLRLFAAARPQ